jgi:hypothetical protein
LLLHNQSINPPSHTLFHGITRPGLFPLTLPLPPRATALAVWSGPPLPPASIIDPAKQARRDADAEPTRLADSRAAAREAALAEAQVAEEEAAAASNDCDAAAERIRAALARAAKARADAAAAADPIDPAPGDGLDVSHAMALHEAAAILNLHAQAVSVQNARSLVQVTLDTSSGNYSRWHEQFLLAVTKYSLQDHIYSDHATSALPDWTRMNAVVKSWLYSTISSDLAEAVIDHRATAREAWLAIEGHFLGNQETRALHLDAKFRAFAQGDLSITDYCTRFKKMADDLTDLGEHVTDRTLVLNVIRGLVPQRDSRAQRALQGHRRSSPARAPLPLLRHRTQ